VILAHHGGEAFSLAAVLGGGGLSAGLLVLRMEVDRVLRRFRRR
jgi:hypothetical protein